MNKNVICLCLNNKIHTLWPSFLISSMAWLRRVKMPFLLHCLLTNCETSTKTQQGHKKEKEITHSCYFIDAQLHRACVCCRNQCKCKKKMQKNFNWDCLRPKNKIKNERQHGWPTQRTRTLTLSWSPFHGWPWNYRDSNMRILDNTANAFLLCLSGAFFDFIEYVYAQNMNFNHIRHFSVAESPKDFYWT